MKASMKETETLMTQYPYDDESNQARNHDGESTWTIEAHDAKTIHTLIESGATQIPSRIDGALFKADAKQLIEMIAAASGLVVEFRKHKKRQYSEETKAKLAERLREMRERQKV